MPLRIELPEGAQAPIHIHESHGSPALRKARMDVFQTIYNAPETTISLREREAMRFPLTVVMGCDVCNGYRMWRDWPGYTGEPIPEEFYAAAEVKDLSYSGFSDRERILIQFVTKFDTEIDTINEDDELWDELQALFSEEEIGDIIIMAGAWLGFGRGLKALGVGHACSLPQRGAAPAVTAASA